MKTPHFLLVILLLMWVVLAVAVFTQSDPSHSPMLHPQFGQTDSSSTRAMDVGGEPFTGPLPWIFGCLILLQLSGCLWLMTDQTAHATSLRLALAGATIVSLIGFSIICWSDAKYVGEIAPLWAGFPEPTMWMLLAIWFPPLLFVVIYVAGFRRWFASDSPASSEKLASGKPSETD